MYVKKAPFPPDDGYVSVVVTFCATGHDFLLLILATTTSPTIVMKFIIEIFPRRNLHYLFAVVRLYMSATSQED